MLDAIEIAFETEPIRIGCLLARAAARADRTRRARCEQRVELGLALLACPCAPADVRPCTGMCELHELVFDLHTDSVTAR